MVEDAILALVIAAVVNFSAANGGEPAPKPAAPKPAAPKPAAPKPAEPKPTLNLKGDEITFDRAKGDVLLVGHVHVVRKTGEDVLTVDCDRMTAKMADGKLERVEATGNVRIENGETKATAVRATFDFEKNVIHLYGAEGCPATLTAQRMRSTGPTIILELDTQKVTMPDGGDTELELDQAPGGAKGEKQGAEKPGK